MCYNNFGAERCQGFLSLLVTEKPHSDNRANYFDIKYTPVQVTGMPGTFKTY